MRLENIKGNFIQRKFYTPYRNNKIYKLPNNLDLYYYDNVVYCDHWLLGKNNIIYIYTNDCNVLYEYDCQFNNEREFNFNCTVIAYDNSYYFKEIIKEYSIIKNREQKLNKLGI